MEATIAGGSHDRDGKRVLAGVLGGSGQPQQLVLGELTTQYNLDLLTNWERKSSPSSVATCPIDGSAAHLYLSPLAAKTHTSRIMTKLNAYDGAQLVIAAYETSLITPDQH